MMPRIILGNIVTTEESRGKARRWPLSIGAGIILMALLWVLHLYSGGSPAPSVRWNSLAMVPRLHLVESWPTKGNPSFVAWSLDGAKVVSESGYGTTNQTGMTIRGVSKKSPYSYQLPSIGYVRYETISNAQSLIGTGDMEGIAFVVRDLTTRQLVRIEREEPAAAGWTASREPRVVLSPDGSALLSSYGISNQEQLVSIYDTRTWRRLSSTRVTISERVGIGIFDVSDNGSIFAFYNSSGLTVIDAQTGTVKWHLPNGIDLEALSPDGRFLAASLQRYDSRDVRSMDATIMVLRIADGAVVGTWQLPPDILRVLDFRWEPHDRFLVFVDDHNLAHIWNPNVGMNRDETISLKYITGAVAFSPDGRMLAIGDGDDIDLFSVPQNQQDRADEH